MIRKRLVKVNDAKYILLVLENDTLGLNSIPATLSLLSEIPAYRRHVRDRQCSTIEISSTPPWVGRICEIILRLYSGDPVPREEIESIPLKAENLRLKELLEIPHGKVITYSRLAERLGLSLRTTVRLLVRNPYPLIIPCHRVVRKNGHVGGYLGSLKYSFIKAEILRREGVRVDDKGFVNREALIY
ncbi:MAG: hypothetical protein DRJ36_02920 [Thermoprotei archaeon]|nr:MAG: hypothetical protein DRJ36_02920 [Thermoprotei archaeon]